MQERWEWTTADSSYRVSGPDCTVHHKSRISQYTPLVSCLKSDIRCDTPFRRWLAALVSSVPHIFTPGSISPPSSPFPSSSPSPPLATPLPLSLAICFQSAVAELEHIMREISLPLGCCNSIIIINISTNPSCRRGYLHTLTLLLGPNPSAPIFRILITSTSKLYFPAPKLLF